MPDLKVIIFIGLQASGKSTFYRLNFADTCALVSKDLFRHNKKRSRRQSQLIEAALQAGRSVVVDNTNPTIAEREAIIAIGRACNACIIGYYFLPNLEQSLERNQQRMGKARVPDVGIYATFKKLEKPTYAEGFEQLFDVQIAGNNKFQIKPWQEDLTCLG